MSYHLSDVGRLARGFAGEFGWGAVGEIVGLLHDIGKTSAAYQAYISRPQDQGGPKGPDHSTAGAIEAEAIFGAQLGRMMAFGIAGHHAGLANGRDGQSAGSGAGRSLMARLADTSALPDYAGWREHVPTFPTPQDLMTSLTVPAPNPAYPGFERFFLTRMLFSCLVDADFIATEGYYAKAAHLPPPARGGTIRAEHLRRVQEALAAKRSNAGTVNQLRSHILDHAVAKAALPPGLFTLTVPTGGGKTLTSLNFALDHGLRWGKRRVIYVIPFTSIIEQTADIFRDVLQCPDDVLEHHSNFDWDQMPSDDSEGEGREGMAKLRRDAENWDAPIIVTTAVQFFESLFARRTSRCRKLHNLANSVIIIDEAQTMPVHLLRPCMAVIDELARNYGVTIVLCTATQPALRLQDGALPEKQGQQREGFAIGEDRELAPDPAGLYAALKRVDVEWRQGDTDDDTIAARFAEAPQMLCIVNNRRHARELFEQIADMDGARHLTTLMCARHRRAVLADIRERLIAGQPVRLVATSLIEAGVDVDFPEVWRAATGLDSIAQAAGRCNREGKLGQSGRVVVFEAAGRKNPPVIEAFWQAGRTALRRAEAAGRDPLGLATVHDYFTELYFQKQHEALDAATIDGQLYPIIPAISDTRNNLAFPFATISDAFRMIDDVMQPVLIPFDDDAIKLLDTLEAAPVPPAGTLRKLQQYSVSVPEQALRAMLKAGAVQAIKPDAYGARFMRLMSPSLYDPQFGLSLADPTYRSAESNIFA